MVTKAMNNAATIPTLLSPYNPTVYLSIKCLFLLFDKHNYIDAVLVY